MFALDWRNKGISKKKYLKKNDKETDVWYIHWSTCKNGKWFQQWIAKEKTLPLIPEQLFPSEVSSGHLYQNLMKMSKWDGNLSDGSL